MVDGLLTLAESRAERQIPTSMNDWAKLVDKYIDINLLSVLHGKGKI